MSTHYNNVLRFITGLLRLILLYYILQFIQHIHEVVILKALLFAIETAFIFHFTQVQLTKEKFNTI